MKKTIIKINGKTYKQKNGKLLVLNTIGTILKKKEREGIKMAYEEERKKLEMVKLEKTMYKIKLRNQTKATHNAFVKKNKGWVRTLDIVMIIVVLLNFGAVFMTNMLVVKTNPEVELKEANAVQAEMNDYEVHEQGGQLMKSILLQTVLWVIILSVFVSNRMMLITYPQLTVMTVTVIYFAFLLTLDFVNDFGYLIGVLLWGA